jgi:hypothetical protein
MKIWAESIPIEQYPIQPKYKRLMHPCLEAAERRGIIKKINKEGIQWA